MIKRYDSYFEDQIHLDFFNVCYNLLETQIDGFINNSYMSAIYLLSADPTLRAHYTEVFDFENLCIFRDALQKDWQTDSSLRTTRLLFNLWNGTCSDGEKYQRADGEMVDLPSENYTPNELFASELGVYYWLAIQWRFCGQWEWTEGNYFENCR